MLLIDPGPAKADLQQRFQLFEADLQAHGVTPASCVETEKTLDAESKPMVDAMNNAAGLLKQAKSTAALPLPQNQLQHAIAALHAAEALSTEVSASLDGQVTAYRNAQRLCEEFLVSAASVEAATSGWKLHYKWDPLGRKSMMSNNAESAAVQRITTLLNILENAKDMELKTILLERKSELEALRTRAARTAMIESLNRALLVMDPKLPELVPQGEESPLKRFVHLLQELESYEPHLEQGDIETAARRIAQIATAAVHRYPEAIGTLDNAAVYRVNKNADRLKSALLEAASDPTKVPDPADLYLSQAEIWSGLREGGIISHEKPERPVITAGETSAVAGKLAAMIKPL
jgi:hypothetical protein